MGLIFLNKIVIDGTAGEEYKSDVLSNVDGQNTEHDV